MNITLENIINDMYNVRKQDNVKGTILKAANNIRRLFQQK